MSNHGPSSSKPDYLLTDEQAAKLDKSRRVRDRLINGLIAGGGIFVLVAITAIFFYLLSVSWPLFGSSGADQVQTFENTQVNPDTALVQLDEYNETGMRLVSASKMVEFFNVESGKSIQTEALPIPSGVAIVKAKRGSIIQGQVGLGLSDGTLLVIEPSLKAQGLGEDRVVTVGVEYPFGKAPLPISKTPLKIFDIQADGNELNVMAVTGNYLTLLRFGEETEELGGMSLEDSAFDFGGGDNSDKVFTANSVKPIPGQVGSIEALEIGQGARWLYTISKSGYVEVTKNNPDGVVPHERIKVLEGARISASNMLQGDISLILGDTKGAVSQWFLVKDKNTDKEHLTKIRDFQLKGAEITTLTPEIARKGIVAGDAKGNVGYFYTTSNRAMEKVHTLDEPVTAISMSSHGDGMLVSNTSGSSFWHMDAHHPEVSTSSLWGKVWYESYPEPDYVWQSSAGNEDFEPKMSLVPLTFGTLKAAFWAMILSAPLAIAGAMYTAIFMNPALRTKIKPMLELMEALPTVILGFLAGLWLAPLVNEYLPAIFSLLIVVPVVILIVGFLWMQMPLERRNSIPAGIAPVVLILPIIVGCVLAFVVSEGIEKAVFADFGGSMVNWLRDKKNGLGIDYQDQNALIVGLMMGFAVIPTIFSIAEDALFAVPRHLTNGSLALGATPWQTMTRVVLPTASPGIFSALMIGLGRAVGETMIVLMATGNTPIMDLSLFNGMRTLSVNVAVEMGEAEVGSTHFRILFLSALVLFILTFLVNTVAEVVRSRLRKKYGSL